MGNNVSGVSRIPGALDSYVSELGADVTYEKRFIPLMELSAIGFQALTCRSSRC